MRHKNLRTFLAKHRKALRKGSVAMVFVEDDTEIASTLRHHKKLGFDSIIALMAPVFDLPRDLQNTVYRIDYDVGAPGAIEEAVNRISAISPGNWMFYCFNAEYLFFPFNETRRVNEMLAFHAQERRDAMLTYVIDLYADDLKSHPNAVCLKTAHLDQSGYYALAREDQAQGFRPKDRQLDFFGGLRWRFEEHIPYASRKMNRIALFRAKPGLTLTPDHCFSQEEYNTLACPWHHNITATLCSFRTAKALTSNPGSAVMIDSFMWHNSVPFSWDARQLLDLGLMEPGQWF